MDCRNRPLAGGPTVETPRRILLLITDLEIGGTPTVVRELAIRLNDPPRVVVRVACLKGWGPVADQLRDAGIGVTAMGMTSARQLRRASAQLRKLVAAEDFDTVFSFLVHANVVAALASRCLPGVRFLQSIQTVQPRPRWHWWAQRWAHRYAERIVVPSNAIATFAGAQCGIPASKFVVIPNAVDPADFPRVNVFAGSRVRVGYLGRLDPAKDPASLILALIFSEVDTDLHYFGEGPARPQIESEIRKRRLGGRVFLHGRIDRPQAALANMDVLWQPSRVEGFGLVLIEAMASGVPVIASEAGGVVEIVSDGENGLTAEDAMEFWSPLEKLRGDSTLRSRLIEGGFRTVRERFRWDVVLPSYRELLGLAGGTN